MNLFYASTPFQIFLSFVIAQAECDGAINVLLLNSDDKDMLDSCSLFCSLFPNVFSERHHLKSSDSHNNVKRFLIQKSNLKVIKRLLSQLQKIDNFYYSSDWKVDVSYMSHLLRNTKVKFHYFEDGFGSYIGNNIDEKSKIEKIGDKLLFGLWRREAVFEGTLNPSAQIHAMYPELLPNSLKNHTKIKINSEKFLQNFDYDRLPNELKQLKEIGIGVFMALPRFELITDSCAELLKNAAAAAEEKGLKVAVKRHPRDLKNENLSKLLDELGNIVELPVEYPAELYYFMLKATLKQVTSAISTALLTAKWLIPDIEAIALYSEKSLQKVKFSEIILKLFANAGVQLRYLAE